MICTELPLFLPWKEFPHLIRILLRELAPSRAPVAIESHQSLVLVVHLLAIRGAHRHNPSMINILMTIQLLPLIESYHVEDVVRCTVLYFLTLTIILLGKHYCLN